MSQQKIVSNRELRALLSSLEEGELVILCNVTLPVNISPSEGNCLNSDIGLVGGRIAFTAPAGTDHTNGRCIDLAGRMVWPRFADIHVHLDKGHVLYRSGPSDGTLDNAIAVISEDRTRHWSPEDLKRRIGFGLHCAWHYGTSLVRTHIDSHPGQWEISWDVFEDIRREWAGRVAVQGSSLVPITLLRDRSYAEALAKRVADAKGSFGAVAVPVPDFPDLLETVFSLAARYALDVDFHADETGDPTSGALLQIARTSQRYKDSVRVVAGHCCSLSVQDDEIRIRTLEAVAEAGIGLISLPACNLYLQDRKGPDATPRWRGLTAFKEARALGITVALASDNTRDPFHPFGDLDMLDTFRLGIRTLHLDDPVGRWLDTVTTTAAHLVGQEMPQIVAGDPADFIIFEGRTFSEVLARGEPERIVISGGKVLHAKLPSYGELDTIAAPH